MEEHNKHRFVGRQEGEGGNSFQTCSNERTSLDQDKVHIDSL